MLKPQWEGFFCWKNTSRVPYGSNTLGGVTVFCVQFYCLFYFPYLVLYFERSYLTILQSCTCFSHVSDVSVKSIDFLHFTAATGRCRHVGPRAAMGYPSGC